MSHRVIKPFFDKTDNMKPYKIGSSYSHKDGKRIAFLIDKGFLEKKEPAKTKDRKKAGD